jgi:uncharacterized membrane protein YphA (DoxX/SURF4 family)
MMSFDFSMVMGCLFLAVVGVGFGSLDWLLEKRRSAPPGVQSLRP